MFCGNPLLIGIVVFLLVAYLVIYGSSSTSIKEGLSNFGGNSAYYTSGGYIYSTEAEADAACKSVGWDGLCRQVDVPTQCACGWYRGATGPGYHMDANTRWLGRHGVWWHQHRLDKLC